MRHLSLFLMLLSCTTVPEPKVYSSPRKPAQVACTRSEAVGTYDPKLEVWVDDFFRDAREFGSTCFRTKSIGFAPQEDMPKVDDGTIIGYCTDRGDVVLSQKVWDEYGLLFNKALLYHELGHCALQLDHAPEGTLNLMAPHMLVDYEIAEHWALLKEKLFRKQLSLNEGESDVVFDRHLMPIVR